MPQDLTDWASVAQIVQAFLLLYALFLAKDIRESIKTRHLEGMKFVRDLLLTPESVEKRKWVYEDLKNVTRPLSGENADRIRAICRDFDTIGLLCRNGLLPADIIVEAYSRNIVEMWELLRTSIDELRMATDPYYYLEFEWLASKARKVRESLAKKTPTETLRVRLRKYWWF